MRIAIILRRMNVQGGTQRLALYLADELTKKGYGVKFYTLFFDRERTYPEFLKYKITFVDFSQFTRQPPIGLLRPLWQFLAENRAAAALARSIDPDTELLNPHDQVSYRVTRYFRKHTRLDIPSVWSMNDPPSLTWAYERDRENEAVPEQPRWKCFYYRLYDWYDNRTFIREQDAIICQDARNVEWLRTYYGPATGRKGVTVRNGPDATLFDYRARKPLTRRVKLLSSGILFPHRRYEDAIGATKLLADHGFDPSLEIVGAYDGNMPYFVRLEGLIRNLGIREQVRFLGNIPEKDLLHRYRENDIFLFQHHWQTDGLSPTEAMISGMAVVVSRTAGCSEFIRDHETGLVTEPKNPAALAAAVRELVENPSLYLKLSRQGMEWIRDNLSPQKQAEGISKVFERAIMKHR